MYGLIKVCVERPVTIFMFAACTIFGGIFCALSLPLDRYPEISYPCVTVETSYPGMGAKEVRSLITIPVEDALSSIKGLEKLSSVSRDGASIVVLTFKWGINPSSASVWVREAVDMVYSNLPSSAEKSIVVSGNVNDTAHSIIAVHSLNGDSIFERNFCDYELRSRLRAIEGAASIILTGGDKKEIHIKLDVEKAAKRGISVLDIAKIIAMETDEIPAGNAQEGDMDLVVLSSARPKTVKELSELIISTEGDILYLKDIASIEEQTAKKDSFFIFNGKEQTSLEIYRRPGADPVRLSRDIKKVINEIKELFYKDIEIEIVYDESPEILNRLKDLMFSIILGVAAVIAIIYFLLRVQGNSILAALSIPFSAAFAFMILRIFGKSLNSMSLSGLALGIGLVTDTSVIILDVLCRKFAGYKDNLPGEEVAKATSELSGSNIAGTTTTCVVFIPVLFLPGPLGALFTDLSISLVSSVIAGWVFAQFILPSLFRFYFKNRSIPVSKWKMLTHYRRILRFTIKNLKPVIITVLLLTIVGFTILINRPKTFIPDGNLKEMLVINDYPSGTKPEYAIAESIKLEALLKELPCIEKVFCRAGAEIEDINRRSSIDYRSERIIFSCVIRNETRNGNPIEEIRKVIKKMNNINSFAESSKDKIQEMMGLSHDNILYVKSNNDINLESRAAKYAGEIKNIIKDYAVYVKIHPAEKRPEYRIKPYRDVGSLTGITASHIAQTTGSITEGIKAGRMELEGKSVDIKVNGELHSNSIKNKFMLESIPITLEDNNAVFLGTIGEIEKTEAYQSHIRLNRNDILYLNIDAPDNSKRKINKMLSDYIKETPELYRKDESVFNKYKTSLFITIILVVILLYMTMGAQFESFTLPVIFMLIIPLSLSAAGPLLLLTSSYLDFGAVLGIIVLLGIVVNNGIVLYETGKIKMENKCDSIYAFYSGACERFIPVLGTTLTTIIVLIPLLINPVDVTQKSMAAAMFGGCAAAALITLFVLPAVFINIFKNKEAKNVK